MADVNGDLVQDLITANYDSTNISVLLGTTRAAAVTLVPLAVSPPSVIGGEFAPGTLAPRGPAPPGGAPGTPSRGHTAAGPRPARPEGRRARARAPRPG